MSSLIDLILNAAGLLLWLNWRSVQFDPFARLKPATLSGTVRRADPLRLKRWHFLAALFGLLLIRAAFYRLVGTDVNWTLRLDLGVVALTYRCNDFIQTFLFSVSSFTEMLAIFYFWLLALAIINRSAGASEDPFQKMIHLQLGKASRWPRAAQAVLPGVIAALLWICAHPALSAAGVLNRAQSMSHLLAQGALVALALYATLKNLLPVFLFLHLIASYVYLGNNPIWEFISLTSRNLLAPLRRLPLRAGKFDFAPLAGIVLILLLLVALPYYVGAFIRWVSQSQTQSLWPQ